MMTGLGIEKNAVNSGTFCNWDDIKIDANKKVLSIKRRSFLNNNNALEFSLDGWTGRYGMPLEFLLGIHVATMMPDLAYDMAKSFPTNVNVYLHETTSGEATAAYKNGNGLYITFEQLNEALTGVSARNLFSKVWSWFDNLSVSDKELRIALKMGVDHSPDCTCVEEEMTSYICTIDGEIYPVIEEDGEYYYEDNSGRHPASNVEQVSDTVYTEVCDACKNYVKKIIDYAGENNDYNFQAYTPYIASVTNHWYRDVYFVKNSETAKNFVNYDYDYERISGERWTLYKTYETGDNKGEYILYIINKDGNYTKNSSDVSGIDSSKIATDSDGYYYFKGTTEEAQKEDIAVSKKAETISSSDDEVLTDLGWSDASGVWTAYKVKDDNSSTGFERIYDDEALNGIDDETEKRVKERLYISITTAGNVIQTGEGQRGETNSKIKKMFLQNKYFKYDGEHEKAEIITKLRNKHKIAYGALKDSDLNKSITVTQQNEDGENENVTYTAKDLSGKVSLNQDALNEFTMLENTHTLDADYIYRDFKELIVELGYFEKEELVEGTPRLLQWIVPDIGSFGYPSREIDKNENEFGTMVHSKGDIDANQKYRMTDMIRKIREAESQENTSKNASQYTTSGHNTSTVSAIATASKLGSNISNLTTVGEIQNSEKSPEEVSVDEFLTATEEVHKVIEDLQFQYCWGAGNTHNSDNPHTDGHGCAGLFNTLEEASGAGGHRIDCSTFVSYCLQAVGLMEGRTYTGSKGGGDGLYGLFKDYIITREEAGVLQPGDILLSDTHTQINGEDSMQYNAGSGKSIRNPPYQEESPSFYTDVIRLPFSNRKKEEDNPYEGYLGNEAVVSPVTGILLEYGTYENQKDSFTNEEYRQNVDLKYADREERNNNNNNGGGNNGNNSTVQVNIPPYDPEKPDKVGYAKILVLDAENYKKLESSTDNPWKNDSLVSIKNDRDSDGTKVSRPKFSDSKGEWILDKEKRLSDKNDDGEKNDPWTEIAKTVYGYKEFVKSYEELGIAGYIVYIDGFKCEEPQEDFDIENDIDKVSPKGEEIKFDSYKQVTSADLQSTKPPSDDKLMPSLYEIDETHKMASEKATEKAQAIATVKEQANSTIYVNSGGNDLVFIKEGTVLGRTLTDYELIVDYRKDDYSKYRETDDAGAVQNAGGTGGSSSNHSSNDEDENMDAVIGNYVRIIMRDLDDTVVENVEDYMKLDDGQVKKKTEVDWEFYYWLPYESGPLGEAGVPSHSGAGACGTVSGANEVAVGFAQWTALAGESWNNVSGLCEWLSEEDPDLCAPLKAFSSYSASQTCASLSSLQNAWWSVNDKDTDRFLELQMKYFYEVEFKQWIEDDGVQWLEEKSLVAQGTYASLKNWAPNIGWKDVINSSMSDEDICRALLAKACPIGSTCGTLEARWNSQFVLAADIIDGTFTEVESWVRTKSPEKYAEGKNPGVVGKVLIFNPEFLYQKDLYAYIKKEFLMGEAYER